MLTPTSLSSAHHDHCFCAKTTAGTPACCFCGSTVASMTTVQSALPHDAIRPELRALIEKWREREARLGGLASSATKFCADELEALLSTPASHTPEP